MDLVPHLSCLHCWEVETIVHVNLECSHVANVWRHVEIWIRKHIDKHAKLSNVERTFGENANNQAVNVTM